MPDGTILAAAAIAAMLYVGGSQIGHGLKVAGQTVAHEVTHEGAKVLHVFGIHRGHLKDEGRKI